MLAMPSHVHPYPHGPPANVATLPAPINCTYSRSILVPSGPFGLAQHHSAQHTAHGTTETAVRIGERTPKKKKSALYE